MSAGTIARIAGVSPVLATAFHPDGALDVASFRRSVAAAMSLAVGSVMFPGYASEYYQLSDDERMLLLREVVRLGEEHGVAVIASVTEQSTFTATARARAMADAGADALNILPPHFLPTSVEAAVEHVEAVATAAPDIPVIVQYAPQLTGTVLEPDHFRRLARAAGNVWAVKVETQDAVDYVGELAGGTPRLDALVGNAGVDMVPAIAAGARGVQPGDGFLEVYVRIWSLWQAGREDDAAALYRRLLPYLRTWMAGSAVTAVGKMIAHRRGVIESPTCRLPSPKPGRFAQALVDRFLREFADELEDR